MALLKFGPKGSRAAKTSGLGVSLPLLVISLVLLMLVSLLCFYSWGEYNQSVDQTRASVAIIASLKNVASWLDRAETNEQAALLTGDARYLRESSRAVDALDAELSQLNKLSMRRTGGVAALPEFNRAVKEKSADLVTNLTLIREHRAEGALRSVKSIRGRLLMDRVRGIQQRLEEEEQEHLVLMRSRSQLFSRLSQIVSTFGSVGIFAIVLISTLRIRRFTTAQAMLTRDLTRANEDLRQFVYSASHDLQEPLRNLMIYSDLIEKRVATGAVEAVPGDARFMRLFANRMRALVADLLLYTQITNTEPDKAASADMSQVMAKVLRACDRLIREAGAEIDTGILPRLPLSEEHAELLMQNLLSNAIQYRRAEVPPQIRIAASKTKNEWLLSFSDNGMGIDTRYHTHIFGIFKRLHTATEYTGTGLGLAICRKIVERAGGRIWVESQAGAGATFYFSLPTSRSAKAVVTTLRG